MIQLLWTILTLAVLLKAAALIILGVMGVKFVRKMDGILYALQVTLPSFAMDFVSNENGYRGKLKLLEPVVERLQEFSKRPTLSENPADADSYMKGLEDGSTELAKYILGELKEESE